MDGELAATDTAASSRLRFTNAGVRWQNRAVELTTSQLAIVKTLVEAEGRAVSHDELARSFGYKGENPTNIVQVHICRLRRLLRDCPIETLPGRHLRWAE